MCDSDARQARAKRPIYELLSVLVPLLFRLQPREWKLSTRVASRKKNTALSIVWEKYDPMGDTIRDVTARAHDVNIARLVEESRGCKNEAPNSRIRMSKKAPEYIASLVILTFARASDQTKIYAFHGNSCVKPESRSSERAQTITNEYQRTSVKKGLIISFLNFC